jgi:hypothetical protein
MKCLIILDKSSVSSTYLLFVTLDITIVFAKKVRRYQGHRALTFPKCT